MERRYLKTDKNVLYENHFFKWK